LKLRRNGWGKEANGAAVPATLNHNEDSLGILGLLSDADSQANTYSFAKSATVHELYSGVDIRFGKFIRKRHAAPAHVSRQFRNVERRP